MALLFDSWFPRGDTPAGVYSRLDANDVGYTPITAGTLAIPEVAARCAVTTAPDGSGDRVFRFTHFATDPGISAGPKIQLAPPFTTANRDPITNWAGSSASRRWYRFKVCLDPNFRFETWGVPPGKQNCCVFQIHDTLDTSPADLDKSPPLWLISEPDGGGWFRFEITSDAATQSVGGSYTIRTACRVKLVPGIADEFVIYMKWAWDNTGAMTIWRNRRQIYMESGAANCSNNDVARGGSGNFAILTNYCHDDLLDRTIYHWGLQIGDESYADYSSFAAACGAGSQLEKVLMRGSA